MSIVLGIDPGLNNTGWGVVEIVGKTSLRLIDCGLNSNKKSDDIPNKLLHLHQAIDAVIKDYKPDCISLEKTFVNQNPLSALNLGYSRAVILLIAAQCKIPIFEYSPNTIKKSVTGHGHAKKEQISYIIEILLNIKNDTKLFDVSDALAAAVCHINHTSNNIAQVNNNIA